VIVLIVVFVVVVVGGDVVSVEVLMVVLIAICLPGGSIEANFMAFAWQTNSQVFLLFHSFSPSFSLSLSVSLVQLPFADFAAVVLELIMVWGDASH